MFHLDRRRVLRGIMGGGAVTVGLPLLNAFLNGNGNAMGRRYADACAVRHMVLGPGHEQVDLRAQTDRGKL